MLFQKTTTHDCFEEATIGKDFEANQKFSSTLEQKDNFNIS
jgi:hypothetical protein